LASFIIFKGKIGQRKRWTFAIVYIDPYKVDSKSKSTIPVYPKIVTSSSPPIFPARPKGTGISSHPPGLLLDRSPPL